MEYYFISDSEGKSYECRIFGYYPTEDEAQDALEFYEQEHDVALWYVEFDLSYAQK